jgi:hypothetical protein
MKTQVTLIDENTVSHKFNNGINNEYKNINDYNNQRLFLKLV